jgi:hypothetical protein
MVIKLDCWLRTRQGRAAQVEGKLLLGHVQQVIPEEGGPVKRVDVPFSSGFPAGVQAGWKQGRGQGWSARLDERPLRPVLLAADTCGRRGTDMWCCGGAPGAVSLAGRPPAAVIPSGVPRCLAAGAWGVRRAGSGINQRRGRAARGGGQTCTRSRAARVRACSRGVPGGGGAPGQ